VTDAALKRTPLHAAHVKAGARMVPFGGWEMPVQYTGIIEEHRATRAAVGIFDVSHMGEFEVEGPQALAAIQSLTTNDASALSVGQVQYAVLCYPDGGIVDDLTVYRLGPDRYMITVNASNIDKDWAWVTEHGRGARWKNVSASAQRPCAAYTPPRLAKSSATRGCSGPRIFSSMRSERWPSTPSKCSSASSVINAGALSFEAAAMHFAPPSTT